jgi:hypothetical protein
MRKLSLLTVIATVLSFSSCEEEAILGCMDNAASNYNSLATEEDGSCLYPEDVNLLLGEWNVDSTEIRLFFDEETIDLLIMMAAFMEADEFEEEMGFPLPLTEDEWEVLATEGVAVEDEEVIEGSILFTETQFTITEIDDITEADYVLVDDVIIEITNPTEDFDVESFTILELNESNLTLEATGTEADEEFSVDIKLTIYLSK